MQHKYVVTCLDSRHFEFMDDLHALLYPMHKQAWSIKDRMGRTNLIGSDAAFDIERTRHHMPGELICWDAGQEL